MAESRLLRSVLLAAALLACAVLLSGCNWSGKGKEVATSIAAMSTVKSGAYSGQMKMNFSAPSGANSSGPQNTTMTFSGAFDDTDPAKPKMVMNMTAAGESTTMVSPGDGRMYVTAQGRSFSFPLDAATADRNTVDPTKIIAALGNAVSGFKDAPAMTNAKGAQVKTITATVSRSELCGPVLEAFGDAAATAGGAASTGSSKDGSKMIKSFCKAMLKKDPRVWFGIDNGVLTDVALTGTLNMPFGGTMGLEVQFHQYDLNKPQTGFDAPANATPLNSMDELKLQGGATSATGGLVQSTS